MAISWINIFLLLLITSLDLSIAKCFFTTNIEVHIINKLPPNLLPLQINCKSKDDDLGYQRLAVDGDYHWRFCENFSENTLFYCDFQWGIKYKVFDVFNNPTSCLKDKRLTRNFLAYCKWEVRSDGFYLEQYNGTDYYMYKYWEWF
ncbi:hypothetical protein P3S68_023533 [Capsicum galapagoense]